MIKKKLTPPRVKPFEMKITKDKLYSSKIGGACPKGLTPYPFQLQAAQFALTRNKSYLALDPGLGKTIVAALIMNQSPGATAFYICPPFLTTNTDQEFSKWCFDKKLILLPDSMIAKEHIIFEMMRTIKLTQGPRILFIDEAHRFKNDKAKRTKALFKRIMPNFERVVFMSGTPMPNSRPVELWPVLKHAAPEIFPMSFLSFAYRFCDAFRGPFGWDFSGFTNRPEFKARITKSFMLRIKKDVLDLPPKMEGLLTVGEKIPAMISKIEKNILRHYTSEDLIKGKIAAKAGNEDLHIATYLRLLGKYKVGYILPYIESLLNETKENLLIFAVHKEVIETLRSKLFDYDPLVITGATPKGERQALVKTFQENIDRRIFLGNIQACGVGFTLTKATRVIFVEFSWVDGENSQASDRAHRIGTTKSVQVQYVVLKDSFDRQRMEVLMKKRSLSI